MRRRVHRRDNKVPAHLTIAAAPAPFVDDLRLPASIRSAQFDEWLSEFLAWRDARHSWGETNDWPGGEAAMYDEEPEIPDAPFDASAV